jgi:hypothetical protein
MRYAAVIRTSFAEQADPQGPPKSLECFPLLRWVALHPSLQQPLPRSWMDTWARNGHDGLFANALDDCRRVTSFSCRNDLRSKGIAATIALTGGLWVSLKLGTRGHTQTWSFFHGSTKATSELVTLSAVTRRSQHPNRALSRSPFALAPKQLQNA